MEWVFPPLLCALIVVPIVVLLLRSSQNQTQQGFRLLQDGFQALQRGFVVQQSEFERSQDLKASTLRAELASELQANRRELQAGLLQTTLVLETKVAAIDARLDLRLQDL